MIDGTASYSNITAGSTGTSSSPHFTVQLPTSLSCGDTVSFQVDISSNEGSWSDTWSAPAIPGSETFIWWTIGGTDGDSTESSREKGSSGWERNLNK